MDEVFSAHNVRQAAADPAREGTDGLIKDESTLLTLNASHTLSATNSGRDFAA